jgi:hypothetical protein
MRTASSVCRSSDYVVRRQAKITVAAFIGLASIHILGLAHATGRSANNVDRARGEKNPSPRFSPEEVIALQIGALSSEGDVKARIQRCFRFASPANRAYTGPLDRFVRMVQSPSYSSLLYAKQFLVGRASRDNQEAQLLLTVVDGDGKLHLFRCFLSKQIGGEFADCWMTDAVVPVGVANPLDQLREARSSPSI